MQFVARVFFIFYTGVILVGIWFAVGRWMFPASWRIRFARLDWFLCKSGSHRCICTCGRGCCWDCMRCHPQEVLRVMNQSVPSGRKGVWVIRNRVLEWESADAEG